MSDISDRIEELLDEALNEITGKNTTVNDILKQAETDDEKRFGVIISELSSIKSRQLMESLIDGVDVALAQGSEDAVSNRLLIAGQKLLVDLLDYVTSGFTDIPNGGKSTLGSIQKALRTANAVANVMGDILNERKVPFKLKDQEATKAHLEALQRKAADDFLETPEKKAIAKKMLAKSLVIAASSSNGGETVGRIVEVFGPFIEHGEELVYDAGDRKVYISVDMKDFAIDIRTELNVKENDFLDAFLGRGGKPFFFKGDSNNN